MPAPPPVQQPPDIAEEEVQLHQGGGDFHQEPEQAQPTGFEYWNDQVASAYQYEYEHADAPVPFDGYEQGGSSSQYAGGYDPDLFTSQMSEFGVAPSAADAPSTADVGGITQETPQQEEHNIASQEPEREKSPNWFQRMSGKLYVRRSKRQRKPSSSVYET